ncbi:hypothetical protein BBJ28_00007075 [Nothophytophthora sp. Chile5]|nr:hypothetical protein BBJ28_00007075 [Nothophytophthora sp. Chile5]
MERRVRGGAASRDAAAGRDSSATGSDFKRESEAAGRPAASEENWSALSNLRVAAELEDESAQTQDHARPGSTRPSPSAGGNSNRSKIRRTSSSTIPSDPDRVSKSSLSFILDDQASSAISSGSTECKVPSCVNRAKSRGFCWSHGGGTKCKFETCEKIAISNGLCWAHGGGCMRQAYERTDNLCNNHYQEQQHGAVEGEEEASAPSSWHPDDEEKPAAPLPDQ